MKIYANELGGNSHIFSTPSQWRTLREILGGGGGGEIFNMYAFGVGLRYANLSNIMLGIYITVM